MGPGEWMVTGDLLACVCSTFLGYRGTDRGRDAGNSTVKPATLSSVSDIHHQALAQHPQGRFHRSDMAAVQRVAQPSDSFVLNQELEELQKFQSTNPDWMATPPLPQRLNLDWEEIEGLPPEVLEELSISESDRTKFNIISGIRAMGGVASLDRIIIYLYKQHNDLQKRGPLNQRLYRMVQKELIFSVPRKKGVYSSSPMSEEDAAKLL